MKYSVGDYVLIERVNDAEGIDSDDMNSFLGHVGVVIEAVHEDNYDDGDQLYLVRFAGTGEWGGYAERGYPSGDQCFTQMTFWGHNLKFVCAPAQPIASANFDEGGL